MAYVRVTQKTLPYLTRVSTLGLEGDRDGSFFYGSSFEDAENEELPLVWADDEVAPEDTMVVTRKDREARKSLLSRAEEGSEYGRTIDDADDRVIMPDVQAMRYRLAEDNPGIFEQLRMRLARAFNKVNNHKGTVFGSILVFTNGIVSAGVLGLSDAMNLVGLLLGILLIYAVELLTKYSFDLLIMAATNRGRRKFTLTSVMQEAFPQYGAIVGDSIIVIGALGTQIAYFVLVGNSAPVAFKNWSPENADRWYVQGEAWIIFIALIVTALLVSFNRNIAILEYFSWYSFTHFIVFAIVTFAYFIDYRYERLPPIEIEYIKIDWNIARAIARIAYTYQSHTLLLPLYDKLADRRVKTINAITWGSVNLATFMYITIGVAGYGSFGAETQSNMLNNYPFDSFIFNLIRLSYTFEIMLSMPSHILARVYHSQSLYYELSKKWPNVFRFKIASRDGGSIAWRVITVVETVITAVIAIIIVDNSRSFGRVITITGAISSSCIVFIFPALVYMRVVNTPTLVSRKLRAALLCLLGFVVMVSALAVEFIDIAEVGF